MSEEKKPEVEGENAGENKAEEPKKEGKFSSFFKKMGQKIDDAAYDSRLSSDFNKKHPEYHVYTGTGVFSPSPDVYVEEHLDGEEKYVVAYGTDENIKAGCLIKKDNSATVYRIAEVTPATLTVEFEGKTNEKPAQKIVLGEEAEKVAVIKVGDEFYKV